MRLSLQLLCVACMSCAQATAATTVPTTIEAAINHALENRLEIAVDRLTIANSELDVQSADTLFTPKIDLITEAKNINNFDRFSGIQADIPGLGVITVESDVPGNQIRAAIEARVNLYAGGYDAARLNETRYINKKDIVAADINKKNILLEVAHAYMELRKAQVELELAKNNRDTEKYNEEIIKVNFQQGFISKIEKEEQEINLLEAESRHVIATSDYKVKLVNYFISMGITPASLDAIIEKSDTQTLQLTGIAETYKADALFEKYDIYHYADEMVGQLDIDIAEQRVGKVFAQKKPRVELVTGYSQVGREESFNKATDDLHAENFYVGVNAMWNIYDGSIKSNDVSRARNQLLIARHTAEQELMQRKNKRVKLQQRIHELEENKKIANSKHDLSKSALQVSKIKYQQNKLSEIDYKRKQQQTDDMRAEVEYLNLELFVEKLKLMLE